LENVWFWQHFSSRQLYAFGTLGMISMFIGTLRGMYPTWLKIGTGTSLSDTALPLFSIFMVMIGVQFFISGILASTSIKDYQHAKNNGPYRVKKLNSIQLIRIIDV